MQHSTHSLGPQNVHLNTPTTVRPKTMDLLLPHTKHHRYLAANKSEPISTSCSSQHKTRTKQATPNPLQIQSSANNNPQNTTRTSNTLNAPPQTQTSATNNPQP